MNVKLKQYKNLRNNFNRAVDIILGEDFYTTASDIYDADKCTCDALINHDHNQKMQIKKYRILTWVYSILFIISLIVIACIVK